MVVDDAARCGNAGATGVGAADLGPVLKVLRKSRSLPNSLAGETSAATRSWQVRGMESGRLDCRISTLRWCLAEIVKAEPLSAMEVRWLLWAITGGQMPLSAEDELELRRAVRLSGRARTNPAFRGPNGRFASDEGERVVGGTVDVLA